MNEGLKDCPFCDTAAEYEQEPDGNFTIWCPGGHDCPVSQIEVATLEEGVTLWNSRAGEQVLLEKVIKKIGKYEYSYDPCVMGSPFQEDEDGEWVKLSDLEEILKKIQKGENF